MSISNLSALKRFGKGNATGKTGSTLVATVLATATTATEANTGAVPTNPTTPAFPTTGTAVKNTNPYAVNVSITAGTVSHIKINGTSTGLTSGNFVVPSGGSVAVTYTGTPTWVWTNADGASGWLLALVGTTVRKVPFSAS